ncbi:hypothetical protein PUN28_007588 [Cardiocondyla obscurior]|uniref:Uncharacterized protein n=1 Tax=Cardiocondyla obscurior TaxID=286306 RepID=A0AAW2G4U6_9HYME
MRVNRKLNKSRERRSTSVDFGNTCRIKLSLSTYWLSGTIAEDLIRHGPFRTFPPVIGRRPCSRSEESHQILFDMHASCISYLDKYTEHPPELSLKHSFISEPKINNLSNTFRLFYLFLILLLN